MRAAEADVQTLKGDTAPGARAQGEKACTYPAGRTSSVTAIKSRHLFKNWRALRDHMNTSSIAM